MNPSASTCWTARPWQQRPKDWSELAWRTPWRAGSNPEWLLDGSKASCPDQPFWALEQGRVLNLPRPALITGPAMKEFLIKTYGCQMAPRRGRASNGET